nr:hypothetical protein [Halomicroarcula sp. SYNS111]
MKAQRRERQHGTDVEDDQGRDQGDRRGRDRQQRPVGGVAAEYRLAHRHSSLVEHAV